MAGTTALLHHTAVAVALVVGLIVLAKINPVISLVIGVLYLDIAAGLGSEATTTAVAEGFGILMAEVGLIIGFGVMLGTLLSAMGTLHRVVDGMLRLFGINRSPYVIGLASSPTTPSGSSRLCWACPCAAPSRSTRSPKGRCPSWAWARSSSSASSPDRIEQRRHPT